MSGPKRESLLRLVEARPTIDDRFDNIKRLGSDGGSGAFSLVFTARDKTTGGKVALKFFNPQFDGNAYRRLCFQREAELLVALKGKADLVSLVAAPSGFVETLTSSTKVEFEQPFVYYAMELAKGSLGDEIAFPRWTPMERLTAFRAACRGVQRLHNEGIVHRDLKPSNFLVFGRQIVKLADLGTARSLDPAAARLLPSYSEFPPGDRNYTAPELLAGLHDEDPTISIGGDMYSLGATLYELFTGVPLAVHIFDPSFSSDLAVAMASVAPSQRRLTFDKVVTSIADGHPLPDLSSSGREVPRCITGHLSTLFQDMSQLDYRKRLIGFSSVFRRIQICEILLRNEARERARRETRRIRRALHSRKAGALS